MPKNRLEAFSDGVIAIIITIMVLELKVPEGHQWSDLAHLWPKLLSYSISFIYVGIYWNNHHHMLHTVRRVTAGVMWSNLALLFWLSLFPFVTAWAGESHFEPVPMSCYAAVAFLTGAAYTLVAKAIIRCDRDNRVLADAMGNDAKGKMSLAAYAIGVVAPVFGHWGAVVTGIIMLVVAVMWLVPDRRIERALGRDPVQ